MWRRELRTWPGPPWPMLALLITITTGLAASAAAQIATPPASPGEPSCAHAMSAAVAAKWSGMGGGDGPLGCPIADEAATVASQAGTSGLEADFAAAAIVQHRSGPRAGQTYAISGCAYRLYFQYGGASGWLGLPIADAINTPDGQKQAFEGGRVTYTRATDDCDAAPSAKTAAVAPTVATSSLDLFFDPARSDHVSAASATTVSRLEAAHYQRVRSQAQALTDTEPGAVSLKLFWNETLGDHVTTATPDGERDALAQGYVFEASQGFVWTDPHPGAAPLKQYRQPSTAHNWLTATPEDEAEATAQGFVFVRIEGYAPGRP